MSVRKWKLWKFLSLKGGEEHVACWGWSMKSWPFLRLRCWTSVRIINPVSCCKCQLPSELSLLSPIHEHSNGSPRETSRAIAILTSLGDNHYSDNFSRKFLFPTWVHWLPLFPLKLFIAAQGHARKVECSRQFPKFISWCSSINRPRVITYFTVNFFRF